MAARLCAFRLLIAAVVVLRSDVAAGFDLAPWAAVVNSAGVTVPSVAPRRKSSRLGNPAVAIQSLATGPAGGGALASEDAEREAEDILREKPNVAAAVAALEEGGSLRYSATHVIANGVRTSPHTAVLGLLLSLLAITVHWFNERRSVRVETLVARGMSECISMDADKVDEDNRGRLVHVQGETRGAELVCDPQFEGASFAGCLKLQSTVEAFEWVQTKRTTMTGRELRTEISFHSEWTTTHRDSASFRKPGPENPRLPSGLRLGTSTSVCGRVHLGAFVLPAGMVEQLTRFQPAMPYLPRTVSARGVTFTAAEDGFFYSRSHAGEPELGDLRVRFLCVLESSATAVAVQCEKDGQTSFVPYRAVPRCICASEEQERQMLIEQGERPLREVHGEAACACGSSGCGSCVCCPCNIIAGCCKKEMVTEEVFHFSEGHEHSQKPFLLAVQRSDSRVRTFRLIGWFVMFLASRVLLHPYGDAVQTLSGFEFYGDSAMVVLAITVTLASSGSVAVAAYSCYQPLQALRWAGIVCLVVLSPFLFGRMHAEGGILMHVAA